MPGGSSGGSAAAVAAGASLFCPGIGYGGFDRQPAAFCGVVGLKPTYGRVSRFGLVAFASSLDQIGPLTKNVEDAAYVLQVISGHDPMDSTSRRRGGSGLPVGPDRGCEGVETGRSPGADGGRGIDPGVREQVLKALRVLEEMGAVCGRGISAPRPRYAVETYYLLAPAEASSNLARYDGVRYGVRAPADNLLELYYNSRSAGFGAEVKRRIMLGTAEQQGELNEVKRT